MVFPANFCRFFKLTELFLRISSLNFANDTFLSSGRMKAWRVESQMYPKKRTAVEGSKQLFVRPMKYPSEIRTAQVINAAIFAS